MATSKKVLIASELRQEIEDGKYQAGDRLPIESELVEHWGVSRMTVRDAFGLLIAEGLISSGRGKGQGYRVKRPPERISMPFGDFEKAGTRGDNAGGDAWIAAMKEQGREATQEIRVSIEIPSPEVAERLKVDPNKPVVARSRSRSIDGQVCQMSTSYFPEELVRGTPLIEPRDVSAPGGILASLGLHQAVFLDEVFVRAPTEEEREEMELERGVAVAEHIRTGVDEDGKPLRCMFTIMPGDRTKITYRLPAK